jgi:hypothetical protein
MVKKILIFIGIVLAFVSCDNHDDEKHFSRTVLVYMAAENNLSARATVDLDEMLAASFNSKDNALLVYVDRARSYELPFLARIRNGRLVDSVSVADINISIHDPYTSNPDIMERVIKYAFSKYPSENSDYGLVLWGHASGWVIQDDSIANTSASRPRRAYGGDTGTNSSGSQGDVWLNMYSLGQVLNRVPHLKFLFADCCNFMCLESLYELRHAADYIIGSPAEIPGDGAPYQTVVPAMFEPQTFYTSIVDRYFEQELNTFTVPLSVVKSSSMDDLADATRQALLNMRDTLTKQIYPDMKGIINYFWTPKFHDVNDFILKYASAENYQAWKQVFDRTVIYKKMSKRWITANDWYYFYGKFDMTEEKFGGVSMFVPQSPNYSSTDVYYRKYNEDIKKMSWYYAVGMDELGW